MQQGMIHALLSLWPYMKITFRWLTFLAITFSVSAWAADPGITLEEAVAKVQKETGGKVLSADKLLLERGKTTEYRLKVLTPDGHVRVVPVRTETSKIPDAAGRDTKEKH